MYDALARLRYVSSLSIRPPRFPSGNGAFIEPEFIVLKMSHMPAPVCVFKTFGSIGVRIATPSRPTVGPVSRHAGDSAVVRELPVLRGVLVRRHIGQARFEQHPVRERFRPRQLGQPVWYDSANIRLGRVDDIDHAVARVRARRLFVPVDVELVLLRRLQRQAMLAFLYSLRYVGRYWSRSGT